MDTKMSAKIPNDVAIPYKRETNTKNLIFCFHYRYCKSYKIQKQKHNPRAQSYPSPLLPVGVRQGVCCIQQGRDREILEGKVNIIPLPLQKPLALQRVSLDLLWQQSPRHGETAKREDRIQEAPLPPTGLAPGAMGPNVGHAHGASNRQEEHL